MQETTRPAVFCCPHCGQRLLPQGNSLTCSSRHSFDMAREGYVNLLLKKSDTLYENRELFFARRKTYEAGFWNGVIDALRPHVQAEHTVLDAGCGEGSLLHALGGSTQIGLDIARPAVKMAARLLPRAAICAGDLCALPLENKSVDVLVNLLTPANYQEFSRVLKQGGILLKGIPGPEHLKEIRSLLTSPAAQSRASSEDAAALLEKKFSLFFRQRVHYAFACDEALAAAVFSMTPLTSHQEAVQVPAGKITVDVEILAAHPLTET